MGPRLLAIIAVLVSAACNRSSHVWSCDMPASASCVQWVGDAEPNQEAKQESCKRFGGVVRDDVCPVDDTVFGRCDSGISSTIYYGRRDVELLRFRCRAAGGTWH
ncbi:MAG TPA: hypothetical protein VFK85_03115 [Anaeromyxobacteraceae bacterium]|nr:hypothetical protein [Anaeromyxobacteraceae bacterium]